MEYKKTPWVLRQNGNADKIIRDEKRRRIIISIAKEFDDFGQYEENVLRHALANFLQVSEADVKIVAKQRGSVLVIVSLPEEAAERLVEAYQMRSGDLIGALPLLPISSLRFEERDPNGLAVLEEEDPLTRLDISRLDSLLSKRELRVLFLFAKGNSPEAIAVLTRSHVTTVTNDLNQILSTLSAHGSGDTRMEALLAKIPRGNQHNPDAAPDSWRRR